MTRMRFNHMELTFPQGTLTDETRADIEEFYGSVFGWHASKAELFGQPALVLLPDPGQFLVLMESDQPLHSPGYDHLGLLFDTRAEVDEKLEQCKQWHAKDARVRVKEYPDLRYPHLTVHAFYVKHLLPIWFDVQCMEHAPGSEPAEGWQFASFSRS
jgi:predicted enzyme related to lactoylglutathione lyase